MSITSEPRKRPYPTRLDLPRSDEEVVQDLLQRLRDAQRKAESEKQRAEAERQAKEKLSAKLRELGIDPDQV